jgi:palmitoyltransferase
MNKQRMKEREKEVLARHYAWYQFRYAVHNFYCETLTDRTRSAKRQLRKQWDHEWGHPDTEGNLWWLGSDQENWISVMGRSKWQWFREFHKLAFIPS